MIQKLSKIYSALTIIGFNTILIFIFLNILAFAGINTWKAVHPLYWRTNSLADLKVVYPGMSQAEILQLLNETTEQPFVYKKFVGFAERPRAGKFVNISKEGFRHTHIKNLRLDAKGINIYVFGGSTTFGFGLDDESTIPAHIQKIYADKYPDKSINVFNFGSPYYYSTQELILLIDLIRNNHIPDTAIFIDGINEGQKEPYFTKQMAKSFRAHNYNKSEQFKIVVSEMPLFRVIRFFMKKKNGGNFETQLGSEGARDNYIKNKKLITELADSYNFKPYFFIQPVPGYKNKFANHMFIPKDVPLSRKKNLIEKISLLDKTVDNKNSFSLTGILDGYEKQPFVDALHYTSDVGKLVAEHIINNITIL